MASEDHTSEFVQLEALIRAYMQMKKDDTPATRDLYELHAARFDWEYRMRTEKYAGKRKRSHKG